MNICQKSIKNLQKTSQKPPKIRPRRLQGTLVSALERQEALRRSQDAPRHPQQGLLEASWRVLGPSWAEKGGQHGSKLAPQKRQIPSWGVLEASWERLGAFWHRIFATPSKMQFPKLQKSLDYTAKIGIFCFRAILT